MKNPAELTNMSGQKISFSFGELEFISENIYKITFNDDTEVSEDHILEFHNALNENQKQYYAICLNVNKPFFCTTEIAEKFSQDQRLKAFAVVFENKDKLYRSRLMLNLTSLLPYSISVPFKMFKNEEYAINWLKKILT